MKFWYYTSGIKHVAKTLEITLVQMKFQNMLLKNITVGVIIVRLTGPPTKGLKIFLNTFLCRSCLMVILNEIGLGSKIKV